MLAVYPVYLIGAFIYYKRNDAYMGNCYFIFGSLFGGIFGLIYIALHFGFLFGWDMNISILAIPMFWGSLAVFALLKPMLKGPVIPLVVYGIAAIWLFTYGLELLSVGSLIIFTVNKYLSLIVGVGTAYLFVNDLLLSAGDRGLPMGPLLGVKAGSRIDRPVSCCFYSSLAQYFRMSRLAFDWVMPSSSATPTEVFLRL